MSGWLDEILRDAQSLGFELDGYGGDSHPRLKHLGTGKRVSTALTPGDRRARANAIALLERISGRKLPRANAGKYRHRRQPQLNLNRSAGEIWRSEEVESLEAQAESLRHRFAELAATPTRDAAMQARDVIARYEQLRRALAGRHHVIEPLSLPSVTA